ncbi:MAG: hypothetical protein WC107_05540 [Patescibacteria group bacterium]|jgi:hypothetical protein
MRNEANIKYNQKHNIAISQIRSLETLIEKHEKSTVLNGANWGQVGDLAHVNELLDELVKFLSYSI